MKKVLFLSLANYKTLGGTQNYNYKLIKLFLSLEWEVTEYNCWLGNDKVVRESLPNVKEISNNPIGDTSSRYKEGRGFMKQVKTSNVQIAKHLESNQYDLIIDARQHPFTWKKKWGEDFTKKDNCIWVQHFCIGLYDGEYLSKSRFAKSMIYLYTNKLNKNRYNVMYSHKNVVLFDVNNLKSIKNSRFKISPSLHTCMLAEYDSKYISKQKQNIKKDIDFIYVGRINDVQKNISYINKIFTNTPYKLVVLGDGEEKLKSKLRKNPNIEYLGLKTQNEVADYLKRSKFLIQLSKYEGFPYTIVQGLSHGVVPIILDTYESAKTFANVGYIFKAKTSVEQMKNNLDSLYKNYSINQSKKCIEFAEKNLSNETFNKKWSEIIKSISK